MKRRKSQQTRMTELRRRAERHLVRTSSKVALPKDKDALKQLHELQVHQIELEMQNQELQRIREEVEEGLTRYTALYDFAPVGYFTLDRDSTIAKLNLTGAKLLDHARSKLAGRRLADFVCIESQGVFVKFLERVFKSSTVEILELGLVVADRPPLFAHIEAIADDTGETCRAVVVDITARREAEQRVDELLRQNRSLTRRMFNVQETERRDLARELHDELGQWLTAIQAEAEAIRSSTGVECDPRLLISARAIGNSAGEIHHLIRQMLRRLRPSLLDTLGLTESLQELTAQWKEHHARIACDLEIVGDLQDVPESLGITTYRIVQEALTNVAKHSHAKHVSVHLQRESDKIGEADCLQLTVSDDGKGLDPERMRSGLGLMGMRERVIAAGGEFNLQNKPQRGVRITMRLPIAMPPLTETRQ
jgi:signal transduction histidine kinase